MRRSIGIIFGAVLAVTVAGCGGGGSTTATPAGGNSAAAQAAHDALPMGMPAAAAKKAGLGTDGAPIVKVIGDDKTCTTSKPTIAGTNPCAKSPSRS